MKYLLTSGYVHKNPVYFISSYLRSFVYPTDKFRKIFYGIGRPKMNLFSPDLFAGVEFDAHNADVFNYETWDIDWPRVEKFKKQEVTIEAVHACYPMGVKILQREERNFNLATKSEKIKKALKSHIELAASLVKEKKLLVFHCGMVPEERSQDEALAVVADNLRSCLDYAQNKNVYLCLENVNPSYNKGIKNLGDDYRFFLKLFKKIDHLQLKIVFDWGHANTYGRNFSYHSEFISALGEKIVYAHLNYNPAHDPEAIMKGHPFVAGWDYHLPLTRIEEKHKDDYRRVIDQLVRETALKEFGKITFEIIPEKLFGLKVFTPNGCSDEEAIESLKILKSWLEV